MSKSHREIAQALTTLDGLLGLEHDMCGKAVTYKSGERGVCLYVEHDETDIHPYCLVKPSDGGAIQLWWLSLTQIDS